MSRPSYSSLFDHRIIFGKRYRKLSSSLCSLLHSTVTSSLLGPQHPILKHPQPRFLPHCERQSFTPIQKNRQNYSLCILIFKFLDSKLEDKTFRTEREQTVPDLSLLLIYSWIEFRFVKVLPKYLHSFTLSKELQGDTKKRELLKNPTKIEEIQQKKVIDRNWTITTCFFRDSNPNYQCLKITSCGWRRPPRMHSFNLSLRSPIARCNISALLSCRFLFQSRSSLFKVFNPSLYRVFRGNLTMTP